MKYRVITIKDGHRIESEPMDKVSAMWVKGRFLKHNPGATVYLKEVSDGQG